MSRAALLITSLLSFLAAPMALANEPRQDLPDAPVTALPQVGPSDTAAPTTSTTQRRWYGWQNLAVGLPAIGLMTLARTTNGPELLVAYPAVLLASPIVHWSHGHLAEGFASMGLSVGSILIMAAAIPNTCNIDSDDPNGNTCHLDGKVIVPTGAILGALLGLALDAAVLAREDVPVQAGKNISLFPQVSASHNNVSLSLAGAF